MRRLAGLLALLALASGASSALAASGPYVAASLGGYLRQDQDTPASLYLQDAPQDVARGSEHIHFDPSALVGAVAAGWRFNDHLRLEAELGYDRSHPSRLTIHTAASALASLDGQTFARQLGDDYTRFTGEVNGFYDIAPVAGRVTPYVGAGVGASQNHQSQGLFATAAGAPFVVSGGSSTQGFAMTEGGLSIRLTPELSVVPAYRYVHYFSGGEDVANVVKLGLRLAF